MMTGQTMAGQSIDTPAFKDIFHRTGRLISYTRRLPLDAANDWLLIFLRSANGEQRIYWESSQAEVAFAGCGVAVEFSAQGTDRFQKIREQVVELYANARVSGPAIAAPRVFGGFSFSITSREDPMWAAFPAAYFMLPRFQLTRVADQTWLTVNRYVTDPDSEWGGLRDEHAALVDWLAGADARADDVTPVAITQIEYPVSLAAWTAEINDIRARIQSEAVDKVVLSRTAEISFAGDPDVLQILSRMKQNYAHTYRFLIEPQPGHAFFGATPELLAELHNKHLKTAALAGSTPRGTTPDADEALGRDLLDSPKNRHEHAVVVNSLRESLRPVTSQLSIAGEPILMQLPNIQHLFTPIEATLNERANILDVVERLHPTPALGGYPRNVALQAIDALESVSRGWYAAPVGWIDYRGNGVFVGAIRSAVTAGDRARLYAGVGVMADSDPSTEWNETGIKFKPMLSALGADHERAKS